MRRCIAVFVATVAIASAAPLPAGAAFAPDSGLGRSSSERVGPSLRVPTERIDAAAKASISALDLQTTFPRREDPVRYNIPVPEVLIWIAVAVVAGFVLYALRDPLLALLGRRSEQWETAEAGGDTTMPAPGADALTAADALSREGRFVEAMHLLLLQSLADIREQLRETFADSWTSREILRGARLDPAGRSSLREIIAAVERTYFGGYPAQGDDYAACRRNFDSLRRILRGGAPA
ncbi:MAG TPA: DUF4129 domain-containing protein [Xanthobacteraceae bacterium]|nr:DUF4129 domain-containing protein [Xanthobacteraceae bacterium]